MSEKDDDLLGAFAGFNADVSTTGSDLTLESMREALETCQRQRDNAEPLVCCPGCHLSYWYNEWLMHTPHCPEYRALMAYLGE